MTGDELRAMSNWAWSEMGNAEQDELAAALDDRDRLEWLEQSRVKCIPHREKWSEGWLLFWTLVRRGKAMGHPLGSLRAAIDDARGKS